MLFHSSPHSWFSFVLGLLSFSSLLCLSSDGLVWMSSHKLTTVRGGPVQVVGGTLQGLGEGGTGGGQCYN